MRDREVSKVCVRVKKVKSEYLRKSKIKCVLERERERERERGKESVC